MKHEVIRSKPRNACLFIANSFLVCAIWDMSLLIDEFYYVYNSPVHCIKEKSGSRVAKQLRLNYNKVPNVILKQAPSFYSIELQHHYKTSSQCNNIHISTIKKEISVLNLPHHLLNWVMYVNRHYLSLSVASCGSLMKKISTSVISELYWLYRIIPQETISR